MKTIIRKTMIPLIIGLSSTVVFACVVKGTDSACLTAGAGSSQSSPNGCSGSTFPGTITDAGKKKNESTGPVGAGGDTSDGTCSGTWTSSGTDCTGNTFQVTIHGGVNKGPDLSKCG